MSGKGSISRVIAGELFKLRRRRSTAVFPVVAVCLAALVYFGLETGVRNNWFGVPSAFFVTASAIGWISNAIALVAVIVTSFFVSQEFALGSVKSAWVRPVSRGGWYSAKILTACGYVTVLFLLAVAVAVALAAFRLGFADLLEKDYLVHASRSLVIRMLLTSGLALFAVWSVVVVTAALAAGINSPGGVIATALGLGIAMMALSAFPPAQPFLLTTYVGLSTGQMAAMAKGLPLPLEWNELIWRSLAAGTVWMALAFFAGRRLIGRKEIKN